MNLETYNKMEELWDSLKPEKLTCEEFFAEKRQIFPDIAKTKGFSKEEINMFLDE